jgi:diketogulonate reductase-like aldo/keto reductase
VEIDGVPLAETWGAMRELERGGLAGRVGVSNFSPAQIEALGGELPAANQIACSLYAPNEETAAWCRQRGIALLAHSPLAAPGLLTEPKLVELADRCGATPAQVVLRWCMERGLVPLPSSTDPGHIRENLRALDITLDAETLAAVDSLAGQRYPPVP